MPRVIADVDALQLHAARLAELDEVRRLRTDDLAVALDVFFASGSAFGPRSSDLPDQLQLLRRDTAIDAAGVEATAAAFAEAEVLMAAPSPESWRPDDAWIERARRRFLVAHRPWAMEAAAPTMDPAEAVDRLRRIDQLLTEARAGGWPSIAAVEALLEEQAAMLADGTVLVDAFTASIRAWNGTDNDPILDRLVADRAAIALLLAEGDSAIASRLLSLVDGSATDSIDALRRRLSTGLREGSIALDQPGLADHLRTTVVNQLAIDQPRYSGLAAALAANED